MKGMWVGLIVPNQKVEMNITNRNKNYYRKLGYSIDNEKIVIDIKHLPKSSNAMVLIECDHCKKIVHKEHRKATPYENHFCDRKCSDDFKIGKEGIRTSEWIKLTCSDCNNEFERPKYNIKENTKNHFCSTKCSQSFSKKHSAGRPKMKRLIVNCTNCNKEVEKLPSGVEIPKYKTGKVVNCNCCNKEFYLPKNRLNNKNGYYCTKECYTNWQKISGNVSFEERKTGEDVKCDNCKKIIYRSKTELEKRKYHYCSMQCKNEHMVNWNLSQWDKVKLIKVNCYCCGKEKEVLPSVYNKNNYFFCSFECYQGKRIEITKGMNTATSIHLKITDLLDEMNIGYIEERHCGYYNLDIYLKKFNLFIEVMGDYWHSNPTVYEFSELNNIQKNRIITDKRKLTFMKNNYNADILYLWESDINNDIELCKKLIEYFIEENGEIRNYNSFNYQLGDNNELFLKNNIITPYSLSYKT